MTTTPKKTPKRAEYINVRISKPAYAYIVKEAKKTKRTIVATVDTMLGV